MSTEKNRNAALAFFNAMTRGTLDTSFLTNDVRWWVATYGSMTLSELGALGDEFKAKFKSGPNMTFEGITAEGDRVAIESVSRGEGVNGKIYNNTYHFLFLFRDGRICLIKEYLDTAYVAQFMAD